MIIDIRTIPPGHSSLIRKTWLASHAADLPPLVGEIECVAAIDRNESDVFVRLAFSGVCRLECARCLESFEWPITGETRLVIRERPSGGTDDESTDYFYDSRHLSVDLGPALYEEIATSLPLKPLCSSECRGIEISTEPAAPAGTDPRWEALKKLKDNQLDTSRR